MARTRSASPLRIASFLFVVLIATIIPPAQPGMAQVTPTLSATFNSIAAQASCTEQEVPLEYKKAADATWLAALPAWNSGGTCRGSIVKVDAGTSYDVRMTIGGTLTSTATIATRTDAIPSLESLTPTHYVMLTGNDATGDGSLSDPWRTITKAHQAAPSGAVVRVGSGNADEYFVGREASTAAPARVTPLTFVAAAPALTAGGAITNVGHRTIIEGGLVRAAPATISDPEMPSGPWVQTVLVGPTTGANYTVWKWTGGVPAGSTLHTLGYLSSTGRALVPTRLARWSPDTVSLTSPEAWAEMAFTNQTYRYGFFQPSGSQDLYVRMPNDASPDTRWWVGGATGFSLGGADSRISGFVIRGFHMGIVTGAGSDRMIVDRNEIQTSSSGVRTSGVTSTTAYPEDMVIERNYMRNTAITSLDQAATPSIPWDFVKRQIILANGSLYAQTRIGGTMEGAGVIAIGSHRTVVRNNTIRGFFDGVGTSNVSVATAAPEAMNAEWDVHDNLIQQMADEGVEPGRQGGWRIYRNRFEHTKTVISTGSPTINHPLYLFDNTAWRTGGYQLARDLNGNAAGGQDGMFVKYDAQATALSMTRAYFINNTFWSDWGGFAFPNGTLAKVYGADDAAGGANHSQAFYLRNNILRVTDVCWNFYGNSAFNEDYSQLTTSGSGVVMSQTSPSAGWATVAAYQAATGQGAHSNVGIADARDEATLDAQFVGATTGNLALTAASVLRTIGVTVPNVSTGATPDLGAP